MLKKLAGFTSILLCIPAVTLAATEICPPMPAAITDVTHDAHLDIEANIGALGKIKAGELVAKGNIVARNVYEKYPDISKVFLTQTMAATYCSMLNDGGFTAKQRADRWDTFQEKVLGLSASQSSIASDTTGSVPAVSQDQVRNGNYGGAAIDRGSPKPTVLGKLVERLSDGALKFQVGTDLLDVKSATYLRIVAARLRKFDSIVIRLEPIQSKGVDGDSFTVDARALYKSRQQQARLVLMGSGFESDHIVFVNDMALGRAYNDVYDAAGNPIEAGLVVQIVNIAQ
ncbi:hypothetical protein [Burkholderia sp. Ax-1719]|uniref:hypothetical protein n=1 Tax=Burkholderia sp. Ax-1719 TaxID=2608334 RepID=UPI00141E8042|nr:hypothetical protein [Burkholderia sp. Ax-1719]NIE63149.1 hypothetical protein [Burkholderia sp. Ax-1719]